MYYLLWYFPSGLPYGEAAGYVFLATLTYELFQVRTFLHDTNKTRVEADLRGVGSTGSLAHGYEPGSWCCWQRFGLRNLCDELVQWSHRPLRPESGVLAVLGMFSTQSHKSALLPSILLPNYSHRPLALLPQPFHLRPRWPGDCRGRGSASPLRELRPSFFPAAARSIVWLLCGFVGKLDIGAIAQPFGIGSL